MSMKYNNSEMSGKYRTFVPNMETKIETTNTGGKVLAYDGDELVGRLEFSDAECKICKYKSLIISVYTSNCRGTDTMPRDGEGTENIQTSANEAAVKNKIYKHLQRRFSSSLYIHIR